jgi:hypothetical protein
MSEKKAKPTKAAKASEPVVTAVNYISSRQESAPFDLKIGEDIIKPVLMRDNSLVWPIPKALLSRAKNHAHIATGRLIEEK